MLTLTRCVYHHRESPEGMDRGLDTVLLYLPDGRAIEIRTMPASKGRVKLGISAPADVAILRGELKRGG